MENFLREHGLWAVVFAAAIERDVVCVLAGILARLQVFPFGTAILPALGGAISTDIFLYSLGRRHSAWIQKFRVYAHARHRLDRFNQNFGTGAIIISQFLYGFRTATMIFAGIHKMPFKTFLLLDLAGCLFLVVLLQTLGYFLSDAAMRLLGEVKAIEGWLLGGLVISVAVIWLGAKLFRKWFADADS